MPESEQLGIRSQGIDQDPLHIACVEEGPETCLCNVTRALPSLDPEAVSQVAGRGAIRWRATKLLSSLQLHTEPCCKQFLWWWVLCTNYPLVPALRFPFGTSGFTSVHP